jgi:hypothetical protein
LQSQGLTTGAAFFTYGLRTFGAFGAVGFCMVTTGGFGGTGALGANSGAGCGAGADCTGILPLETATPSLLTTVLAGFGASFSKPSCAAALFAMKHTERSRVTCKRMAIILSGDEGVK